MADLEPQRIGEFIRIVFSRLWEEPSGLPAGDVLMYIPKATPLSDYEKSYYPSTTIPRYEKIIRLATIPLVKAGWLVKSKGRWYLTEEGRRACRSFQGPEDFYKQAVQLLDEWRQSHSALTLVTEEAEEQAWAQIRQYLQAMKPYEFQDLAGELLKAMGYHVAWIAPPEKDHGRIDLVAYTDPIGAKGPRILVQLQHKGQPVTMEGLKAFLSVMSDGDYGLLISTGGFTYEVSEARRKETFKKTTLLDLENFFDLWVRYYDQLSEEARARFPLTKIYFLSGMQ